MHTALSSIVDVSERPSSNVLERRSAVRVSRCSTAVPDDLADALWRQPIQLLERGELLQANGARRTVLLSWGGEKYVLKHYVEPSWRHSLKQLAVRSRARSTWLISHRLADAGVATPRPLACVENRWGPMRRDSYLMYAYIEGRSLRSCLSQDCGADQYAVHLWHELTILWERLQELRVSLADANLGNFIVSPTSELWVIDLDKSRFHRTQFLARRRQQRAWRQVLRSAARCGFVA